MLHTSAGQGEPVVSVYRRALSILLWLALITGWLVSIFSVIEELCLATACSDAASFTFFGAGMGWFGIAYFCLILLFLWLRPRNTVLNWAFAATVFSGIGAELRLLWIQKYIIGGWCPLCVTICCALFFAAALLLIEKVQDARTGEERLKGLLGWIALMTAMIAIGLSIAVVGIKALV
ncbi:MAG: vitamin K epoxide reductase family protein [Geobacteraceae bacterium]|nr:vitamin K epoxide reductase family protein [Geobacteraceae bacterium]